MNFHSVGDRFAQFTPNKAEISNYCQIERFGSYKISFVTLRQKKLNVASHLSYDTRMFFSACPFLRIQWFWVLLKCLKYQACFVANFKRAVSNVMNRSNATKLDYVLCQTFNFVFYNRAVFTKSVKISKTKCDNFYFDLSRNSSCQEMTVVS